MSFSLLLSFVFALVLLSLRFDPDTAVPSRRDGQVEALSACLAAQSTLQQALMTVMRGDSGQVSHALTRSGLRGTLHHL